MYKYSIYFCILAVFFVAGCARPGGHSAEEKRTFVLKMLNDTLVELYAKKPEAQIQVAKSAGYAVFSDINTQFLFFGTGQGYGLAVDNSNDSRMYMNMLQASAGVGVALKDFREVIIFNDKRQFMDFIFNGWEVNAGGGAAAKAGSMGSAVAGSDSLLNDVIIYQVAEKGVELRVNFAGQKYWLNNELN